MLVDTHAHLYWDSYKTDLDQVVKKCLQNDVRLIINVGVDLETSKQCLQLLVNGIRLYPTIGIHPHDALRQVYTESNRSAQGKANPDESIPQYISELEGLYTNNKDRVVAIGECGLDYHSLPEDSGQARMTQLPLYRAQVELARKLNLPLVIHCRDAWNDIFIPELQGTTGVFHNFSGTLGDALRACKLGYYLSFSCVLTYPKNQELRDLVAGLPLDRILTETDCPFLPPQSIRGQRNDPSSIPEVVRIIAETRGLTVSEVANQVYQNTQTLFRIV